MADVFGFDSLEPIEVPFKFRGKSYVLREASEDVACRYRNAILRVSKVEDGKFTAGDGFADTSAILVSGCLFEVTDGGEKSVPLPTVRAWPARVVKPLFQKAKEISDLDEKETPETLTEKILALQEQRSKLLEESREGAEKNSPSATTPTSDSPAS